MIGSSKFKNTHNWMLLMDIRKKIEVNLYIARFKVVFLSYKSLGTAASQVVPGALS